MSDDTLPTHEDVKLRYEELTSKLEEYLAFDPQTPQEVLECNRDIKILVEQQKIYKLLMEGTIHRSDH